MSPFTITITSADGYEDRFTGESLAHCLREVVDVAALVLEQLPPVTLALLLDGLAQIADLYAANEAGNYFTVTVSDPMNGDQFTISLEVAHADQPCHAD